MNIKRNIIFSLESRKKNGVPIVENVPIRMRVVFDSHRIEFTTGYRIDVAKWDADKQRVKNGCTNKLKQSASEINADLLKYYTEIQNIFKEFEVQGFMPTTEQVKDIKTALNLFGNNRQSHRAAGDFLYSAAKQKGELDNREKIKAKREIDNVVNGYYDQQQKRTFSIKR